MAFCQRANLPENKSSSRLCVNAGQTRVQGAEPRLLSCTTIMLSFCPTYGHHPSFVFCYWYPRFWRQSSVTFRYGLPKVTQHFWSSVQSLLHPGKKMIHVLQCMLWKLTHVERFGRFVLKYIHDAMEYVFGTKQMWLWKLAWTRRRHGVSGIVRGDGFKSFPIRVNFAENHTDRGKVDFKKFSSVDTIFRRNIAPINSIPIFV